MAFEKHLLIDAANVLHSQPQWKDALRRNRSTARELLAAALRPIHDLESIRVTLVFDGRGPELTVERPGSENTFSILHTPASLTADDVIERLVAKSAAPDSCIVATADRAIRSTVEALGATSISPDDLVAWLERVNERQARAMDGSKRESDRNWRRP